VDDHARRIVDGQPLDDLGQFIEHGARERIDACAFVVQGEQYHAFVVFAGVPVFKA